MLKSLDNPDIKGVAMPTYQLWPLHAARFATGNPFDPMDNARAALSLWYETGWRSWVCQ